MTAAIVGALLGIFVGIIAGYFVRKNISEAKIGQADKIAKDIVDKAERDAETLQKEKLLEAKEEIHKWRSEAEKENKERRLEVQKYKEGYFINDSYNINLNGVKESLKVLHSFKGEGVVIIGGIIEQGKYFNKHNSQLKNLLKDENVIFIGERNHPLIKFHSFKTLFIVSSLKEAYTLIDTSSFTNILLLAKSDDIYLK